MTNEQELAFLKYFYDVAGDYMGPADCDIYDQIKENFIADGGVLEEPYYYRDEEEEGDETCALLSSEEETSTIVS